MCMKNQFGGKWTNEKLERVRKYLAAYVTIMSKQKFRFAYIDAFAGTGYRNLRAGPKNQQLLFPELAAKESQQFLAGSVRLALEVTPRFTKYIFIEIEGRRHIELEKIKLDFPALKDDITIIHGEANSYLQDLCRNYRWDRNRAVLFLDPYGMQVTWETRKAISATKAIDLWILFPLGVAVNRLLKRNGRLFPKTKVRLDALFGLDDWYNAFYQESDIDDLFSQEIQIQKIARFDSIAQYFVRRLKSIFAGVAENPLPLYNSTNNPLYLLCFACGNERGKLTALKIAQDILRS